jgi:hypothetical protein
MGIAAATVDEAATPTPPDDPATPPVRRRPGPFLRDRLTSADPLVPLVGLVSLVVYLLHGFDRGVTRDLGLYTYAGQRFLEGDPPYVGVLNRAGPLAHVLPGVGIALGRLVGLSDIHGARVFYMLLSVACVCLVYIVVRDLSRLRSAALVAAAAFLGFEGFLDLATYGPREKTPMVLFLLACILAVRHRRWATSGVCIALATLTWQPVFFMAVVIAVVAALLAPDRRLVALARIVVGGTAVSALVILYYAVNGAVHTFLDCFVLINASYTQQSGALAQSAANWSSLRGGYGSSLWVILLGLAALPVAALRSAPRAWRSRKPVPATWVALGAGCLSGLAWCAKAFNGWPDLLVMLPLAGVGVGWGAAGAFRRLRRVRPRAAVAAAVVLVLAGTTYAVAFSVTARQHQLQHQQDFIDVVLAAGPHPATIVSMEAPQVLMLTHRTNPTPYQMFDHGFADYLDATYPGGLGGYLADVQRIAPTYIVTQNRFMPDWFEPWLEEHYASVGITDRFHWWVSKSLGPDVRHRLHQAQLAAKQEWKS